MGGVPQPTFSPMAPNVSTQNTQPVPTHNYHMPTPTPAPTPAPSPAPAPTPAPTPSSMHIFDHYGGNNGGNGGGDNGGGTDVDPEVEAEECKEKLESLDESLDDIDSTCRGQAINVATLTIMTNDQKSGEVIELRRDIKTDADNIAGLKQQQLEQQKSVDNLNARIAAMKMTLLEMTMNLQQC